MGESFPILFSPAKLEQSLYGVEPKEYITTGSGSTIEINDEPSSDKININTASASELKSLHGIGDVLSRRIINARPFNSIHEIKDVKGIGPKTFEDIRWEISAE